MQNNHTTVLGQICAVLPEHIAGFFFSLPLEEQKTVVEIRLRCQRPLMAVVGRGEIFWNRQGRVVREARDVYCCTRADVEETLQRVSRYSLYALEEEIRHGFITLPGGHRVGLAGQAIMQDGILKALKNITTLNIRLAREVKGCADRIMPYLLDGGMVLNTLIVSPPGCGKTTLLRDIARQCSNGIRRYLLPGLCVGIVDERGEIAASIDGIPSMDVGIRTDVLDSCPKAAGMLMLIRSMAPRLLVTDELGRREDVEAVQEAARAGVIVITSAHGTCLTELRQRPYVGELMAQGLFQRYVVLSNRLGIGTVEGIFDGQAALLPYGECGGMQVCG